MTDQDRLPGQWADELADLYRLADCRPEQVEGVGWLALRLLGDSSIDYAPSGQLEPVRLLDGPWRILVSPELDDAELTLAIARALAVWWFSRFASRAPDAADVASLAAAIAVPLPALTQEIDRVGDDVEELSESFNVPVDFMIDRLRLLQRTGRSGTYSRLVEAS